MTMATLKLENLSPELLSQIRQLAQQNQCSVDQQAIALIQQSLARTSHKDSSWSKRRQEVNVTLRNIRSRRRVNPQDHNLPDSTQLIREDRER